MMFDHYIRLFNIEWIEPWMIEAMAIVVGGILLMFVICKTVDFLNGDQQ